MRITIVHSRFDQLGGAERYALELARAYAGSGHEVTILTTTPPPDGPWRHELLPVPRPARLWRHPSAAGKVFRHLADAWPGRRHIARQIQATRPDVVHLHNWHHIGAGPIRSLPADLPVLHTVHDFALADPSTTLESQHWSAVKRAVLRARGAVLVPQFRRVHLHWPSARTRDLLAAASPEVLRLRSSVVPLSVRSTVELAALADQEPVPGTFLFLGHLSEHKGLADVLGAWPRFASSHPGVSLVVAGDGPLRSRVEAMAADDASVTYLGYIDDEAKRDALRAAAWVLFPSRWHENFSITCVEALAAGRPVISSVIARPPMASDTSLLAGDVAATLEQAAGLPASQYAGYATSARRDGAALGWTEHVQAITGLLHDLLCETAPRVANGQDVHPQ